ncbi:hypothetical protein CLV40_110141 [Actinokineospora auranticolor]|uniref:Uncharacterized protein n=1 Tax=Actinokineospora auranticolor TaxID=155976 RepID=A0A2S6GMJ5_9PSEU|nr:hypothetical protein CLV40_110141 [Actinokineospora auranticolor]
MISVVLYDSLAVDEVPDTAKTKPLPDINGRKAIQITGGTAFKACTVSMAVAKKSSVAAIVMADNDETKGCELARTIAELIDPTLPRE